VPDLPSIAFTFTDRNLAARALLSLVGLVNIPIIKYSVEWRDTLHQPASLTLTEKPSIPAEMRVPLLIMVAGFCCFFTEVLLMRSRVELLDRERRTGSVKDIISSSKF